MTSTTTHSANENTRYILFMVVAMAGFAVEDAVIKQLAIDMPISQVLILIGLCGVATFFGFARIKSIGLVTPVMRGQKFIGRTLCELLSAVFFVSAFVYSSLSAASAILQATPLVVALGGAIFLKQSVRTSQWVLIGAGLVGVMMIIQPGSAEFDPATLLAVGGVVFLAIRDLLTRSIASSIAPIATSFWGFFALMMAGVVTIPIFDSFVAVQWNHVALLCLSTVLGAGAYFAVVMATRGGDVAVVAPFRYSRLVFALILSVVFFDEVITLPIILGSLLIIGSGLISLRRTAESDTASSRLDR